MSAGRRRAETGPDDTGLLRHVLVELLGCVAAAAAWVVLVVAAIGLGRAARAGGGATGWLLTVVATVGAALCLLLVFLLVARVREVLRSQPRHGPGRHR